MAFPARVYYGYKLDYEVNVHGKTNGVPINGLGNLLRRPNPLGAST